ncbi:adp-ribosylation factor [Mycena sp. CBHHK59/15]|nr:adp-ribosylation factor [Mycena sp. CBHHK59/15]
MGGTVSIVAAAKTSVNQLFPSALLPKSFEIIMVGLDDAGKTSIVNRLHRRELPGGVLPQTIPTIGCTIETIPYGRNSVTIWEFGGLDKIRPLWRRYYWNGHAFIFALNAAAPERFSEAREELLRMHNEISHEHPLLVLANKMDLHEAVDLLTVSQALDVERLSKSGRKIALKGVSAMSNVGLDEAMQWRVFRTH